MEFEIGDIINCYHKSGTFRDVPVEDVEYDEFNRPMYKTWIYIGNKFLGTGEMWWNEDEVGLGTCEQLVSI